MMDNAGAYERKPKRSWFDFVLQKPLESVIDVTTVSRKEQM